MSDIRTLNSGSPLAPINDPYKEPVRMSRRLREASREHQKTTGLRFYQIAGRAGIDRSILSLLLHGKVVGKGDARLAKIGRWMEQQTGLPADQWEEPA